MYTDIYRERKRNRYIAYTYIERYVYISIYIYVYIYSYGYMNDDGEYVTSVHSCTGARFPEYSSKANGKPI